jgi:hypothetical protein
MIREEIALGHFQPEKHPRNVPAILIERMAVLLYPFKRRSILHRRRRSAHSFKRALDELPDDRALLQRHASHARADTSRRPLHQLPLMLRHDIANIRPGLEGQLYFEAPLDASSRDQRLLSTG